MLGSRHHGSRRMRTLPFAMFGLVVLSAALGRAQAISLDPARLKATNVTISSERLSGRDAVKVVKSAGVTEFDEATFAKITDVEFRNGTIEVKVLSRLRPDAPAFARGFIGVAFRISEDDSRFEGLYVRPTNARADDQVRRNRTVQYFSYPGFKFDRLRQEAPGKYESYADMALNEWIALRIVVRDDQAQLFVNGSAQPVLIVNDLKHGADASGAIGLWVDVGTEGCFSDLRIYPQ